MTGCLDGGSCLFDEKNNTFSCFKKPQSGDNSQVHPGDTEKGVLI